MISKFDRLMLECNDTLSQSCNDIIIDTKVEWAKNKPPYPSGVLELCPNQKIIITASGSLSLNNFKLTKKTSTSCSDLAGNWDGIHIQGGSFVPSSNPTPPTTNGDTSGLNRELCASGSSLGSLYVLCGSVIEYSNNGIQAPNSAGEIVINNSTMIHNLKTMSCRNSVGGVKMNAAVIDAREAVINRHFEALNSPLTMVSSHIFGSNLSGSIGLYSYQGLVYINSNSRIDNFKTGLYKDQNSGYSSLTIKNSKIICDEVALINYCQRADIMHNEFEGKIFNYNQCYALWYNNKFGIDASTNGNKEINIINPQQLQFFKRNYFDNQSKLILDIDNGNTNALCNTWKNYSTGVTGNANKIKDSWGTINAPSGNIWVQSISSFYSNSQITNYHTVVNNTKFNYKDQFTGLNANTNIINCNYYSNFTGNQDDLSTTGCDQNSLNQEYLNLYSQLNGIVPQANGYSALQNQERSDIQTKISDVFYRVMPCIESSSEYYSLWYYRFDQKTQAVLDISKYWNSENFASIIAYTNIPTADFTDFQVLKSAAIILNSYKSEGKDIKKLNPYQVHQLKMISFESQGDFTEELRSWLYAYYNTRPIYLAPDTLLPRQTNKEIINSSSQINMSLVPNPSEDCFQILDFNGKIGDLYKIQIFSIDGKLLFNRVQFQKEFLCLKSDMNSGIYLARIENTASHRSDLIKLIVK
ncbi:MAG: T9SS type A sorting domain-containing protein [Saprospiraceae bacterium]